MEPTVLCFYHRKDNSEVTRENFYHGFVQLFGLFQTAVFLGRSLDDYRIAFLSSDSGRIEDFAPEDNAKDNGAALVHNFGIWTKAHWI